MKKHEVAFADIVLSRCDLAGIREIKILAKKTGIDPDTISAHLKDGRWKREQLQQMHRFLHFEAEDMLVFLEGR